MAEGLLDLADHLPSSDRALLRGVYDRGMTPVDLARAVGQRPHTVRQRLQRLVERIGSPGFIFVLRSSRRWPRVRRDVGQLVFLQGCSQRAAATRLGLSLHRVRQEVDHIRLLLDEAQS